MTRHQVIKLTEAEAVEKFPCLVIASLGANRKDKPTGVATARVLHDGTNGLAVNTRSRICKLYTSYVTFSHAVNTH